MLIFVRQISKCTGQGICFFRGLLKYIISSRTMGNYWQTVWDDLCKFPCSMKMSYCMKHDRFSQQPFLILNPWVQSFDIQGGWNIVYCKNIFVPDFLYKILAPFLVKNIPPSSFDSPCLWKKEINIFTSENKNNLLNSDLKWIPLREQKPPSPRLSWKKVKYWNY